MMIVMLINYNINIGNMYNTTQYLVIILNIRNNTKLIVIIPVLLAANNRIIQLIIIYSKCSFNLLAIATSYLSKR